MPHVNYDGLAYFKSKLDGAFVADVVYDDGALLVKLGNGTTKRSIMGLPVIQERSTANERYPALLCYDEAATAPEVVNKIVKYGHDVQVNPAYGYVYLRGLFEEHPSYNRTVNPSSRASWMIDFRDAVSNPMSQIYSYIDPVSQGGEHRMEFRLYGNPYTTSLNLPNYNFETDTVSLGVSSTKGDKLTFFGYAP